MKLTGNKYNWKFYFKISISILVVFAVLIYTFGSGGDLLRNKEEYWKRMLNGREDLFVEGHLEHLMGWNTINNVTYILVRNLFLITTLGNIAAAAFFFNSAMNNEKEGQGKFDNYFWGIIVLTLVWWLSILYNLSLLITGDTGLMKWYNYISWVLLHSVVQFAMLIYFVVVYKKYNVVKEKRKVFLLWVYAEIPLLAYMFLFTAAGMIAKASHSFAYFGDMSSDGHFPYDFFDFTNDNTNIHLGGNPQVQYVLAIFGFIIFNSIWICGSYYVFLKQSKELKIEKQIKS